jgi:hypothetical protein
MSAASARLDTGTGHPMGVHRTPAAAPVTTPGEITIVLGTTPSGLPVTLAVTSLEWLDDLESAIRQARAAGVVEAGMRLAVIA